MDYSYLNEDVLYCLGLLYGKGEALINENTRSVVFRFKIKFRKPSTTAVRSDNISRKVKEPGKDITTVLFNEILILCRKFSDILGVPVLPELLPEDSAEGWGRKEVDMVSNPISLDSEKLKKLFGVSNIDNNLLDHIPKYLNNEDIPKNLVRAFLQGIADAAAVIPGEESSAFGGEGLPRIQIEFDNKRWYLPVECCQLSQVKLNVPVQDINWGHPTIRARNAPEKARRQNHQFRVYAGFFEEIGFRLEFKRQAFASLLKRTNRTRPHIRNLCPSGRRQAEPSYNCSNHLENEGNIPPVLKGRHFNAYYQVCHALGCPRVKKFSTLNV
jgi:hypothetical protein